MGKFGGDYRGGVGKSGVLEHKSGNISETRKDRGKVTMQGLGTHQRSFERKLPSSTPYGLPFPNFGGSQLPPKTPIAIISGTSEATDYKLGRYIHRVHPNKSP